VSLVRPYIGRVKVKERLRRVPAPDDPQGVATLNLYLLQADRVTRIEVRPLVGHLFTGCAEAVVAKTAVQLAAIGHIGQHPYGPGSFYPVKHIRVGIDRFGLTALFPAVKADFDLPLHGREIPLQYPVEADNFPVGVIDDFHRGRFFGKEYRGPFAERPAIYPVFRDHARNPGGKLLFAPVIR
jgi:hypothetical protein